MLKEYLEAALRHAAIEPLPDGEGSFASIPALPGVWGNAETSGAARDDLREAPEGWVALALQRGIAVPEIDGVGLTFRAA